MPDALLAEALTAVETRKLIADASVAGDMIIQVEFDSREGSGTLYRGPERFLA